MYSVRWFCPILRTWPQAAPAADIAASAVPPLRKRRRLVPFKFLRLSSGFILPPETANETSSRRPRNGIQFRLAFIRLTLNNLLLMHPGSLKAVDAKLMRLSEEFVNANLRWR